MLKEKVLNFLELNRGRYVSGAKIASELDVSRNAIWKAIKGLEGEGYLIEKRTNQGYMLKEEDDKLSLVGIEKLIKKDSKLEIEVFQTIDSTNKYLFKKGSEGGREGLVAVAESQGCGKGRLGRTFFSPSGGVYFSILLRPDKNSHVTERLTVLGALAVCESINELFGVGAGIKWVNDIYIGNKKCSGILTEASIDFESGSVAYAVLGVGINVYAPDGGYPDDIKDIACAVDVAVPNAKNKLVATVLNKLLEYYYNFNNETVVERYRALSIMVGQTVIVKRDSGDRKAVCKAIDDECRLVVKYLDDNEQETLYYGEVSLCLLK